MKVYPLDRFVDPLALLSILLLFLSAVFLLAASSLDEAFDLGSVPSQVCQWILYIVNDHINHVSTAKLIGFQVGSIDSRLNTLLLSSSPQDSLFDSILGHKSVHSYSLLLAYSVSPVSGLGVHCRVPVVVVEDHCVSCDEVDAESTCPCRKDEDENVGVRLKLFDHEASILELCRTVHPEV